jgi:hypothetical protein
MKFYTVEVTLTEGTTIQVLAESEQEAIDLAKEDFRNSSPDWDDFTAEVISVEDDEEPNE